MRYILLLSILEMVISLASLKAQFVAPPGWYEYGKSCSNIHKNVSCPDARPSYVQPTTPFFIERNASVHISYFKPGASRTELGITGCSGTLIFHQPNGGGAIEFYVLSAAHCQTIPGNAVSDTDIMFTFNFQYPICNGRSTPSMQNTVNRYLRITRGATIVARGNWGGVDDYTNDYILYKLDEDLTPIIERDDDNISVCFGCIQTYQTPDVLPMEVFSFHHPAGDVKKFSLDRDFAVSPVNTNFSNTYYEVQTEVGNYQRGSSGCALFATNPHNLGHCIIGILSTGTRFDQLLCDPDQFRDQIMQFVRIDDGFLLSSGLLFIIPNAITTTNLDADELCFQSKGPNCFNNEKDGNETGIDCGGDCAPCQDHCYNNNPDWDEDAKDCGGRDCLPCHCFNGDKDADEKRIDCGGNDCPPCRRPLGIGDGETCQILTTAPKIIDYCLGDNRNPKTEIWVNANCALSNYCFVWRENGQNNVSGDINSVPEIRFIIETGQVTALTYSWDFHGGLPPSFPITKTYILYIYADDCQTELDRRELTITIYGIGNDLAGRDLIMCLNQTEQLGKLPPTLNTSYTWTATPPIGLSFLSATNVSNPIITATQTGTFTYHLAVQNGSNCTGSDEVIITVDNITRPAELRLSCVVPPDYYHAGRIYTAETCSTTITAPEPTDFVGAQEVNLLPGFTASVGATFTARIAPCDVDENALAPPPEPKTAQKTVEKPPLKPNSFSYDLFPNPTDGTFTLRYTSTDARLVNVRLYDNIGRLLTETSWQDQNRDFEIDVSRYSAGLYHIYVSDGRQTVVKKLFKR